MYLHYNNMFKKEKKSLKSSQKKNNFIFVLIPFFSDQTIPSLESVFANDEIANSETNKLAQLINKQTGAETYLTVAQSLAQTPECAPPPVVHEFQTARLFLSHFGLLNLDAVSEVKLYNILALHIIPSFIFRKKQWRHI